MNKLHIKEQYLRMGKNVITPHVIKWEITNDRKIVELSKGEGLDGLPCFGVSEFEDTPTGIQSTRRGELFYNRHAAGKFYKKLTQ